MKVITDVAEVGNKIFKESIFNLFGILVKNVPDYFGEQKYDITVHDDFAEVVWQLKKQVMAEDLTDILEKKIGANVMYASSEEDGKIVKVEAYSVPVEYSMYVIYISSDQNGIVESVTVHFYDSLDIMYYHLRKDYDGITKVEKDIIEKQSLTDLVSIFI